jgi:hypothetical protein
VQNHNNTSTEPERELTVEPTIEPIAAPVTPKAPWHAEVGQLLAQAAKLCVEHGVELDNFMKGAWSAYIESRPGMRDYLEEMHLIEQLDEARKAGRVGEA